VRARRLAHLLSVLACATLVTIGLGACGQKSYPDVADANNDGGYVQAGPITYQLQISRPLNAYSVEDRTYLTGVTAAPPGPTEEWFGVFLWAKNQTHTLATTPPYTAFDIVDTAQNRYYPISVDPQANPYAWTPTPLRPLDTVPVPGSTAFYGASGGLLVLFKINQAAYANRPLVLEIRPPGESRLSRISLDL
jgi:hypothetical protein